MKQRDKKMRLLSIGMVLVLLMGMLSMTALGVEGDGASASGGQEGGSQAGEVDSPEPEDRPSQPEAPEDNAPASNAPEEPAPDDTETDVPENDDPEAGPEEDDPGDDPEEGSPEDISEDGEWEDDPENSGPAGEPEHENDGSAAEFPAPLKAERSGRIVVDGLVGDWEAAGITSIDPGSGDNDRGVTVTGIRAARDTDGTVYLCLEGSANAYSPIGDMSLCRMKDGRNDWVFIKSFGGAYAYECDGNGGINAPFVLEFSIPADYFTEVDPVISFNNVAFPLQSISVLDGVRQEEPEIPVYNGIEIDGRFQDWTAVTKYPAGDPNNCIDQTAMVFDGDSVYIYIHETNGGMASSAGSHSNGMYAITTDMGRTLLFQLTADGRVNGVEGAAAEHVGAQWEIRIPAKSLPYYASTISYGLYLGDKFVSDVANLDGSSGTAGSFTGVVIDGRYDDWNGYPHVSIIEYATPGTTDVMVDSEGALYVEGNTLYGHVETTMPAHLAAQGGDFLAAISIAFNGDRTFKEYPKDGNFYPCMLDENGKPVVDPVNEYTRLEKGTYTFAICDTRSVGLEETPRIFGTMKITVNGVRDQMEFEVDLEKIADYIGASASDFKLIEAQFGRLGQQWLSVAGTSSGPWLGLGLCAVVCAGALWVRKRRGTAVQG